MAISVNDFSVGSISASYGKWVGSNGKIMVWITEKLNFDAFWFAVFVLVLGIALLVRESLKVKEEGFKVIFLPIVIILISGNLLVGKAAAQILLYGAFFLLAASVYFDFLKLKEVSALKIIIKMALVALISTLLFGNWALGPFIGGVAFIVMLGVKLAVKRRERGSRAERELAKEAGYDVRPEEKIISKEHKAEGHADHEGVLGEVTETTSRVEERNVEMEIHAAALAAGVEEISDAQKAMGDAELSAEQRNTQALEYAKSVDKHIKAVGMRDEDDARVAEEIKDLTHKLVAGLEAIAKDEEYADKQREHSEKVIDQVSDVMIDAAQSAKAILHSEISDEKTLKSEVNRAIKNLGRRISTREKKMQRIYEQYKRSTGATKAKIEGQISQVHEEIARMETTKKQAEAIRDRLIAILNKGRRVLKAVKHEAKKLEGIDKHVGQLSDAMDKYEKKMGVDLRNIRVSFDALQKEISNIDKGALPEEVLIKASASTSTFFESLKKFIDESLAFHRGEFLPMVQADAELLQSTYKIEKANLFANRVSTFIDDALKQLAQMVATVGTPEEKKDTMDLISIDDYEKEVSKYAFKKNKKLINQVRKSYGDLGQAANSVKTQIGYLEKEKSEVDAVEKETVEALDADMKKMSEMRKKQFSQMQGAYTQAQKDLSKAQHFERKERRAA